MKRFGAVTAASPPILLAALIVKLWASSTLGFYVNSRTVWIVLLGGAAFGAVGAVAMWQAARSETDRRPTWRTALFLLPILSGLVIPARPLSALSGQSSALGALQLAGHVSSGTPGDQFGTWVNDLASHPASAWWTGRPVTLVGFATFQTGLPARSFIVGRYIVTCCVVDATLMGFPVHVSSGRLPADGSWVQVSGKFGNRYWTDPAGEQYPIVENGRVGPVSIPSSPYLSP